jgi:O-antigen ligase
LRDDNTSYTSTLDAAGNRGWLWEIGWVNFLASPIWGWGFEKNVYSHNLFIGALADQGIVGFIFLLGVIVFFIRRSRGVWSGRGPANVAIWRAMFVCIGIFGLSHGLVSSDVFSEWHLYWSAAFLWWLGQGLENSDEGIVVSDKITSLVTRHSSLVTHHSAEEPTI